jgi:polysaccharide deacetylase family sporulation protein PdaB
LNSFRLTNGPKIKKYLILVVAALFTAGVIYVEKDAMSTFYAQTDLFISQPDEPYAIEQVQTKQKKVALTFDISWGHEQPEKVLEVLAENSVTKATFFLSAPWAEHYPDIVQHIKEKGYEIGSHGHKHINYTRLKDEEIREQIQKAHRTLRAVTGLTPTLLRPPNGDFDQRVLRIADQLGYTVIHWSTNSRDWTNPGTDKIVDNVLSSVKPGHIILMHASDSAKQTPEALKRIIKELKAQGYQFVTVTELITGTENHLKELN